MRVLLVHPPLFLGRSLFNAPALSGLGTLYTAGHLQAAGHEVTLLDAFLLDGAVPPPRTAGRQDGVRVGGDWAALGDAALALAGDFDLVLVTKARWWSVERGPEFRRFLARLRAHLPGARLGLADLFIGDLYLPPYEPGDYLAAYPELDLVLHGAGEAAVAELLEAAREDWPQVPGLAFREPDGGVHFGGFHYDHGIADLDSLAPPAYELAGLEAYLRFFLAAERSDLIQESHEGEPFLALLASRGCNHRCRFCAMPGYGIRYRAHSVEYLEALFVSLHERSGVRKFILNDPAMNMNRAFFGRFLRMMAARGFRFLAPSGIRADRIDEEAVALLRQTSPVVVTALESPDFDFSQIHVKKGVLPQTVVDLATRCQDAGLALKVHYIVGLPGESVADVNRTLAFALHLYDEYGATPLVQIATPIPGCEMFAEAERAGYLREDPRAIAESLPELFMTRSVLETPTLAADTVTRMYARFQRYIGREHPRELMLAVTFACNNRCEYCMFGACSVAPLTREEVGEAARAARARGVTTVIFEGGEPTLHPRLVELIGEAREAGMREIMLESNARRLADPGQAQALAASGVTMVAVTLQGPDPYLHDATTGKPGSFVQSVRGIANLLAAGFRDVMLNIPLHEALVREEKVEDMVRLGQTLGIRAFMLQYLSPYGRLAGESASLPPYEQVLPQLAAVARRFGASARLRISNIPPCLLRGLEDFVHPDVNNIGRIRINEAGEMVSIPAALAQGKQKDALCAECEWGFLCTGFLPQPPRLGARSLADLPVRGDR